MGGFGGGDYCFCVDRMALLEVLFDSISVDEEVTVSRITVDLSTSSAQMLGISCLRIHLLPF